MYFKQNQLINKLHFKKFFPKVFAILLTLIEIANLVFAIIDALKPVDVKPIFFLTPSILIATYVIHKKNKTFSANVTHFQFFILSMT